MLKKKIRILHLEDMSSDAKLILRELTKSQLDFDLLWVTNEIDYKKALKNYLPDLILSDHSLPGFSSVQALKLAKEIDTRVPFILLTATVSEEFAVTMMREGAVDYILKDRLPRLVGAITNALGARYAEEAKLKVENRFRGFFEAAPEAITILNIKTGKFTMVNNKAIQLLEYSGDQLLEKTSLDISPEFQPDGRRSMEKAMEIARSTMFNGNLVFEWMVRSSTGREFLCEIRLARYSGAGSKEIIVSFVDISHRKLAEEKLEQQNIELIKINAELDRFVYSASHELRAPLASVLGLIYLAKTEGSGGRQEEKLEMMESSIKRLDAFIQDIVHYSRNSRLDLKNEKIDFHTILSESVEGLQYIEHAKLIKIGSSIEGDIDFFSDKKRISILLNNFLSNAIKYHDINKAHPVINICIRLDQDEANIEIMDNGLGIAPEFEGKIFDMFYRATEKQAGSGLGLFIVKEILDKMNGTVQVKSVVNEGSVFSMSIPNSKN
jgi:PAS domain S-box-containing protein